MIASGNWFVVWWRKVLGGPAPLEVSPAGNLETEAAIPADRLALIQALRDRQHQQANRLTVLTNEPYVTALRARRAQSNGGQAIPS